MKAPEKLTNYEKSQLRRAEHEVAMAETEGPPHKNKVEKIDALLAKLNITRMYQSVFRRSAFTEKFAAQPQPRTRPKP